MSQLIKATAPQTQKVHIEHAKIEIMDGIANLQDAILLLITSPNFKWSEQEKQDHKQFIGRAMRKLEGLFNYFNLPE
ncbi:MAG TPA: hypothetical protein VJ464_13520 [Blastocatellia bacterium]|nr:hypothetical protein [Blastocatellia bacterium]